MTYNPDLLGPLCVVLSGAIIAAVAWLFGDDQWRI